MTSEEKKLYNQKYRLAEKELTIRRIIELARDITVHGGGDVKFKPIPKNNKK